MVITETLSLDCNSTLRQSRKHKFPIRIGTHYTSYARPGIKPRSKKEVIAMYNAGKTFVTIGHELHRKLNTTPKVFLRHQQKDTSIRLHTMIYVQNSRNEIAGI